MYAPGYHVDFFKTFFFLGIDNGVRLIWTILIIRSVAARSDNPE